MQVNVVPDAKKMLSDRFAGVGHVLKMLTKDATQSNKLNPSMIRRKTDWVFCLITSWMMNIDPMSDKKAVHLGSIARAS